MNLYRYFLEAATGAQGLVKKLFLVGVTTERETSQSVHIPLRGNSEMLEIVKNYFQE